VVLVAATDWDAPRADGSWSSSDWRYSVAVFSGRDGTLLWRRPVSDVDPNIRVTTGSLPVHILDVDGDASPDVVIASGGVRAFRGRDGEPLWRWELPADGLKDVERSGPPTLAAGDPTATANLRWCCRRSRATPPASTSTTRTSRP
jgi:hypothetical protein